MKNAVKIVFIALIALNIVVLLVQAWPAGALPFARVINILFLSSSLPFFIYVATKMAKIKHGR